MHAQTWRSTPRTQTEAFSILQTLESAPIVRLLRAIPTPAVRASSASYPPAGPVTTSISNNQQGAPLRRECAERLHSWTQASQTATPAFRHGQFRFASSGPRQSLRSGATARICYRSRWSLRSRLRLPATDARSARGASQLPRKEARMRTERDPPPHRFRQAGKLRQLLLIFGDQSQQQVIRANFR